MTGHRQPVLPAALLRACTNTMDRLGTGGNTPAAWVHAGALARHAVRVGLAADAPLRDVLADVAALHPRLAYWAGLDIPDDAVDTIEALWTRQDLPYESAHDQTLWYSHPLGDLYQLLSTEARKGRALCQTPWWVTELLLKISYDRATWDWDDPRVIDPSCGTGHILVETLRHAIRSRTLRRRPDLPACLDAVRGVDLDPHAAATAAYRLITFAWAGLQHQGSMRDLASLPIHVAAADSLLSTDEPLLERGAYQVVVANPPYITVKDRAINQAVRERYPEVCSGKYSLALPFHQLMMELLTDGGWCAQLTANSFMKREFGTRYVEAWLPQWDARWVIDTSGAYIPGHGTPTVIMCHRQQPPTSDTVATIMGLQGEPAAPEDASRGLVWTAIRDIVYARENAAYAGHRYAVEVAEHLDHQDQCRALGMTIDAEYTPPGWVDPRPGATPAPPPVRLLVQPSRFELLNAA